MNNVTVQKIACNPLKKYKPITSAHFRPDNGLREVRREVGPLNAIKWSRYIGAVVVFMIEKKRRPNNVGKRSKREPEKHEAT